MARFYVLPPRERVETQFARLLEPILPGMQLSAGTALEILQLITERAEEEVYLVHREDLPEEDLTIALRDGFGAQAGDRIVQVATGPIQDQPTVRTWIMEAEKSPARAAAFV